MSSLFDGIPKKRSMNRREDNLPDPAICRLNKIIGTRWGIIKADFKGTKEAINTIGITS